MTTATKTSKPKFVPFSEAKGTVADFISDGIQEAQEIGGEFREIVDNTPENLQQTALYSTRESTAETLEALDEPDYSNDILGSLACSASLSNGRMYRGRISMSRATRANNAAAKLRAAADACSQFASDYGDVEWDEDATKEQRAEDAAKLREAGILLDDADAEPSMNDYDTLREAIDAASTLEDECNSAADEIEGAEYPGMFG